MIEIRLLPGSEVEIIGEIPVDIFESFRPLALKELSQEIRLDGFRPGKIPEKILLDKIGEPALLERMALLSIRKEYPKIIKEHKIKAIGRPAVTITKIARNNPLGFKIRTFVMPEAELPDYKKLSQETAKNLIPEKRRLEILNKIIDLMKVEVPVLLVEAEKLKILEETKANLSYLGLKWDDYLSQLKKTEEELLKEWEKEALQRIKIGLALDKIAEEEKITVSKEELEEGVKKIAEKYKDIDKEKIKVYTYGIIRDEKIFKLLESC
jgi:FKBP-type peptidyl-prolyl cis-trans isomerase (trigger factor)